MKPLEENGSRSLGTKAKLIILRLITKKLIHKRKKKLINWTSPKSFVKKSVHKMKRYGNFLVFQCLGLHVFTAKNMGSIHDQGTNIPHATLKKMQATKKIMQTTTENISKSYIQQSINIKNIQRVLKTLV